MQPVDIKINHFGSQNWLEQCLSLYAEIRRLSPLTNQGLRNNKNKFLYQN
jgi:hypothetical protein